MVSEQKRTKFVGQNLYKRYVSYSIVLEIWKNLYVHDSGQIKTVGAQVKLILGTLNDSKFVF